VFICIYEESKLIKLPFQIKYLSEDELGH